MRDIRDVLSRRLPAARVAVATAFFLSGVGVASWVVRIPDIQQQLSLSKAALGLALLGISTGSLLVMPFSGALVARFGSRAVGRTAALAFAAAIALPPHAHSRLLLALVLVAFGASNSIMSVAMNTQAAAIERRYRRPIMTGFHALFSLGGLVGAGLGGLVAGAGVSAGWHLGAAALLMAALTLAAAPSMLPAGVDGAAGGPAFARPTRSLFVLGTVAFCVLFGEGAMADWSAVYLRDVSHAGPGLAAAGYAAFSLMMAAGRFVGDALTVRLGPVRLVRLGAATAAAGVALALVLPHPAAVVLGFAAVGAGLSAIFPTVLAAAGRAPGSTPSTAIAAVSSIGYTGFLAGPPLIGFVAEAVSLRGGVGIVGVTSLLILGLAGSLARSRALPAGRRIPEPEGLAA